MNFIELYKFIKDNAPVASFLAIVMLYFHINGKLSEISIHKEYQDRKITRIDGSQKTISEAVTSHDTRLLKLELNAGMVDINEYKGFIMRGGSIINEMTPGDIDIMIEYIKKINEGKL